ncbi:MAG TPA: hypothetical protein VG323_12870 [Thermoanaerobaculia bacterium]|nr:hypothetical protein [Thermoanaerobaculia bacterium]
MRKLTLAALLLFLGALPAQALTTRDFLSLIAMPLAVAAVSDLNGVPQDQLTDVVSTLNQADVPPTQFVQVVRYVPVALVAQPVASEPTFTQWLDSQTVTGPALVRTIDNRLTTTYGVTPVVQPTEVVYVDDNYIPPVVVTRLQPVDPVAVAAMPLAVAAVSELTGIPQNQLGDLALMLNQADVPPTQFVQVVSYAPQTLVVQQQPVAQPAFVDFVRTQTQQGLRGPALATSINRELPRFTGPPGQVKKQLGLQTGAEVVHGQKPGRQFVIGENHGRGREVRAVPAPMSSAVPPAVVQPTQPVFVPPGQAKKEGGGEEHGNGKGHGHGHGHGKDDR